MRQITKRQLDRQGNKAKIKEWLPFELVIDGEVVAIADNPYDWGDIQAATTMTVKPTELRFSKSTQVKGGLPNTLKNRGLDKLPW